MNCEEEYKLQCETFPYDISPLYSKIYENQCFGITAEACNQDRDCDLVNSNISKSVNLDAFYYYTNLLPFVNPQVCLHKKVLAIFIYFWVCH